VPLRRPLVVRGGEKLTASFFRRVAPDERRVWYEWAAEGEPLQNLRGWAAAVAL